MALDLTGGTNWLLGSPPMLGEPFTFSAWFNAATSHNGGIFATQLSTAPSWNDRRIIMILSSGLARIICRGDPGQDEIAVTTNTYSTSTWTHVFGIFASDASRTCVLDGDWANRGTNTDTEVINDPDEFTIGVNTTWGNAPLNGSVAEVAIWDSALGEPELDQLAAKVSPLLIQPADLVAYIPFVSSYVPWIGAGTIGTWTETGSPGVSAHPPIIRPRQPAIGHAAYVAPQAGGLISHRGMEAGLVS